VSATFYHNREYNLLRHVRRLTSSLSAFGRNGFSTLWRGFLLPNSGIGHFCDDLILLDKGFSTIHLKFGTQWLWLVTAIVEAMNRYKVLCVCFILYSTYVAGILNSMNVTDFYVVCSEKLNYADHTQKCVADKKCTVSDTGNIFRISKRNN
jgi:hypothetical protein